MPFLLAVDVDNVLDDDDDDGTESTFNCCGESISNFELTSFSFTFTVKLLETFLVVMPTAGVIRVGSVSIFTFFLGLGHDDGLDGRVGG